MKDLSLHVLDIAQNSIAAGARHITVSLIAGNTPRELEFEIADDGRGMEPAFLKTVADPFSTSRETRSVGLGIPLIKQSAEMTGGEFKIESAINAGTVLRATFRIDSIDRIPIGDIPATLTMLITANPDISWVARFKSPRDQFVFDLDEVKQVLDGISLQNNDVLIWIQNTINEGLNSVFGGVLDEVTQGA